MASPPPMEPPTENMLKPSHEETGEFGDLELDSNPQVANELSKQTSATVAASKAPNIINPDPTPQAANNLFYNVSHILSPILEKDSVQRFLRYLKEDGRGVRWHGMITTETFNHMMIDGSLKCAKVALEGEAPELKGHRANPNCMNQYGYYPLHEAAESFNADMIKLLLDHGALPGVRTAGTLVVENLLPLHVAVENTCMHKYLEDNLFPNVDHLDYPAKVDDTYIYKLIHLLCLPEMRIFLDTTRVLAENTDNLLDEIWNYVKDCKVVQTAIILMAAQKHIRGGFSSKRNCGTKVDGFSTITNRLHQSLTFEAGMFQTEEKLQQRQAKVKRMLSTSLLVNIVSQAGEAIDEVIRARSEASHAEILDGVSSILKIYGFYHSGEVINVDNLCPYEFSTPNGELSYKNGIGSLGAGKITAGVADLPTPGKKGVRKRMPRGWKHQYTWLSFFPYWRSVLASQSPVKVFPGHALSDPKQMLGIEPLLDCGSSSMDKVSSPMTPQPSSSTYKVSSPMTPQPSSSTYKVSSPKRPQPSSSTYKVSSPKKPQPSSSTYKVSSPKKPQRSSSTYKVSSPMLPQPSSSTYKVSSPTPDPGSSEMIPQPLGIYQPSRAFGTAAVRLQNADNYPVPSHNVGLWGRIPQPEDYLPKRVFGTTALRILKMLRKA